MLEVNPRASRTVPFASQGDRRQPRRGRLPARRRDAELAELGLPAERPPRQVSVKAAVLPFARFPGADPVLGPEMRSTGEVMATARDLPTAFAKAERAAGRPLPRERHGVPLGARRRQAGASIPVAAALAGLGFELLATGGTARALEAAGLAVEPVRKVTEDGRRPDRRRPDPPRPLRPRRQHARRARGARSDGYLIREAALVARVPCITTISRRRGRRARDRERALRGGALAPGADRCRGAQRLRVVATRAGRPVHAAPRRARRRRPRRARAVLHARGAGPACCRGR